MWCSRPTAARASAPARWCAAGYQASEYLGRRAGALHSTWAFASEPIARPILGWPDESLVWETSRPYVYLRRTRDGRIIMGGEDEPFKGRHSNLATLTRKTERLVERFGELLPGVAIEPAFAWAGTFAETKDGLPWFGAHKQHGPRVLFAMAYGGNGISYSMLGAGLLRAAVERRKHPLARLFGFER